VGAEGFESLLDVDLRGVAGVAGVAENGAKRGALDQRLDEGFVQAGIEAGGDRWMLAGEDRSSLERMGKAAVLGLEIRRGEGRRI